ncbi:hypothetical protein EDD15DRAFT_2173652, partial [Pisolithus albus]
SCWDIETHAKLWQIEPGHTHRHMYVCSTLSFRHSVILICGSGFSALSPDQRGLLVSNLSTGADLYRLGQSTLIQRYPQHPHPERNYPLVVSFLHKGNAVICGASKGDVFIRDTWTGEHQQMLEHDGNLSIEFVCFTGQYRQMGYIATATAEMGRDTYIKIWKANLSK